MADMQTWGVRLFGSLFRRFVTLKAGTNVTITETFSGREATLEIAASGGGGGGAPTTAQYLVGASDSTLTAERVVTDTATVTWDLATAGQAKASVPAATTSAAGVVQLATSAQTTAGLAVQASDTRLSDSRAPTGAASGDLGGTYPSPTVTDLTITSEAHGDLLYRGSSAWLRLAPGTADQVLTTQGAGAAPTWQTLSSLLAGLSLLFISRAGYEVTQTRALDIDSCLTVEIA